tara:strand:+ start:426 stop:980 length:555 start_codon:yes stop_codon:yes gene_type:complete
MPTPERYSEDSILTTYLETKNITIYAHGPVGIPVFESLFKNTGTQTMMAFVKPYHWTTITNDYVNHTHILVIRDPIEQHNHAAYLQGVSMRDINRKRDNMFYSTHLRPYLGEVINAQFDFYIDFAKLNNYLFDYVAPEVPPGEPVNLFDIGDEIRAYNAIKETKMELEVPQWRELIMRGQLESI